MKWTPSKMIARLGKEINNPESVYYWAQKVRGWVGAKLPGFGMCCFILTATWGVGTILIPTPR